jgi:hypothetical protein
MLLYRAEYSIQMTCGQSIQHMRVRCHKMQGLLLVGRCGAFGSGFAGGGRAGVRCFAFFAPCSQRGEGCRIEGEYYQVSLKRTAWPR